MSSPAFGKAQDVLGFARLNRASLVVDAMASCPKAKWKSFITEPWLTWLHPTVDTLW